MRFVVRALSGAAVVPVAF